MRESDESGECEGPTVYPVVSVGGPPHRQHRAGSVGRVWDQYMVPSWAGARLLRRNASRPDGLVRSQHTAEKRGPTPRYTALRNACAAAWTAGRPQPRVSASSAVMTCTFHAERVCQRSPVRPRREIYRHQLSTGTWQAQLHGNRPGVRAGSSAGAPATEGDTEASRWPGRPVPGRVIPTVSTRSTCSDGSTVREERPGRA